MPDTTGAYPMPYPNSGDVPDGPADILALAQEVDDQFTALAGVRRYANVAAITALPSPRAYDRAVALDTGIEYRYSGSAWVLDYEVYTNAITARAGFTVAAQRIWRQGRVVSMALQVTKSSAFGLADLCADINLAVLFPQAGAGSIVGGGADNGTAALRACSVSNTGSIQHLGGSGALGTNAQQLYCTWIIA